MKITKDSLIQQILKNSSGTFLLRMIAIGTAFPLQIMITRALGEIHFGEYIYTRAWILTFAVFAQLGLPLSAVRFVSEYRGNEDWGLIRGFVKRGTEMLILASTVFILVCLGVVWFALLPYSYIGKHQAQLFAWALLILPVTTLQNFYFNVLRGSNLVLTAIAISTFSPVMIALSIWVLDSVGVVNATGQTALITYASITAISVVIQLYILRLNVPQIFQKDLSSSHQGQKWFGMSFAVFSTSSIQTLIRRLDILIIGTFLGTTMAGLFAVAKELVRLSSFGLQVTNSASAHFFSQLYTQNRLDELRQAVAATALLTFITSFPIVFVLAFYPEWMLSLFGKEFVTVSSVLLVLLLGEIANSVTGPNGVVLNMTGHHRKVLHVAIITLIVDVVLMWLLAVYFGVIGAAMATAVTIIVRNIGLTWLTWKEIRINTTIFSRQTWKLFKLIQQRITT